jgi:isopenicillin N synthase-like dioxygenase
MGFIHVTNIEGYDEPELLEAIKAFHAIPESEKEKLVLRHHNKNNKNIIRGLMPFINNDVNHKEWFDMGNPIQNISDKEREFPLHEETPFPTGKPEYDHIKQVFEK